MSSFFSFITKHKVYTVLLFLCFILGVSIRIHDIRTYNPWWADDGGAHVAYVNTLFNDHVLPDPSINYLAWHEPGYYALSAVWKGVGTLFGIESLAFVTALQLIFFIFLFILVWLFTYWYSKKNIWLSLYATGLISVLFSYVKVSTYITNEFLVQVGIIFGIAAFLYFRLYTSSSYLRVSVWALFVAGLLLIKVSAVLLLFGACVLWGIRAISKKQWYPFLYIVLTIFIIGVINSPWLMYKHHTFGESFSINSHESVKQSVFTSDAWEYMFSFNGHVFSDNPYWFSLPYSFSSIIISDTFSDYYNLFHDADRLALLPEKDKTLLPNNRYTTAVLTHATLRMNQIGLGIFVLWVIGLFGTLYTSVRSYYFSKKIDYRTLFVFIMIGSGWGALIYNNLRLPYLDRGVLKIHFVLFVIFLMSMVSSVWWWNMLKVWYFRALVLFLPLFVYTVIGWSILFMK